MSIILQIAGIIFILLVIFGLIFVYYVRRMVKRIEKDALQEGGLTPSTIRLKEDDDPAWLAKPAVEEMTEALRKLGFEPGTSYRIPKMPGVKLFSLFLPKEEITCVLYDHPSAGNWADLVIEYEDGEELTVSSASYGSEIESRPCAIKRYLPGASIEELFREILDQMGEKSKIRISDKNFQMLFEDIYSEEMAWRNRMGGVSRDEMRRVAQNMGMDFSADDLDEEDAYIEIKMDEILRLHDECLEQFAQETDMSVARWRQYEDEGDFFVVSDLFDPSAFAEYLRDHWAFEDQDDEEIEAASEKTDTVTEMFQQVNQTLAQEKRLQKIGAVERPVQADIYWIPVED